MKPQSIVKMRGIVSLALLVLFVILVFTGIFMYLGTGKGARLHTIAGFLMALLVVIHLAMNYKMLAGELKALFGRKK